MYNWHDKLAVNITKPNDFFSPNNHKPMSVVIRDTMLNIKTSIYICLQIKQISFRIPINSFDWDIQNPIMFLYKAQ